MIEMWDELFSEQDAEIGNALNDQNGLLAFELMHKVLDSVWNEVWRVMKEGGMVCVNGSDLFRHSAGQIF